MQTQEQTNLFGFFEVNDRVTLRIPEDYPNGPLKQVSGSLGIIESIPFNDPDHYFVRVEIDRECRPLWRVHSSLLRLVGVAR